MKVQLKDGFEVEVREEAMNSWTLLSAFRKVDKGDTSFVVDAAEALLGEKQVEDLAKHLKDEADAMITAIGEIIESVNELKNS